MAIFKNLEEVREYLEATELKDTTYFTSPDYADAIIGIDTSDCLVYDYNLMIEHLVNKDGMEPDEAAEFIDYNTIRTIPYIDGCRPIIMYGLD